MIILLSWSVKVLVDDDTGKAWVELKKCHKVTLPRPEDR